MEKIIPFLWFNNNAEEAVNFYTSIFKNSGIKNVSRSGDAEPGQKGQVFVISFWLNDLEFIALNGGPKFQFNESVSFVINCEIQEDIDHYWNELSKDGGEASMCGWLKDKFGLSWQVVPNILGKLMSDKDAARSQRVRYAMLQMKKMDIAVLQKAFEE
jgi:predicted 3-demethylubiquinone-9 3-methyltransferase (glyoxalase superfamily)